MKTNILAYVDNKHLKVLSQDNELLNFEPKEKIPYDPKHKLEDEEIFVIEEFSKNQFCIDICKENFNSTSFHQIPDSNYRSIKHLCIIQNNLYFFQNVTFSRFIQKKLLTFSMSVQPRITHLKKSIEIKDVSDAIYDKSLDILHFRDLLKIKTIFQGIEKLYREATNREVESFLSAQFILTKGFDINSVKDANRKRIAILSDELEWQNFSEEDKKQLIQESEEYVKEYVKDECIIKNGRFFISTDKQLKYALYVIDERFYTPKFRNKKRLASAIRTP